MKKEGIEKERVRAIIKIARGRSSLSFQAFKKLRSRIK